MAEVQVPDVNLHGLRMEKKRTFFAGEVERGGGVDAVVDATTNMLTTTIPLGGCAGNTVYDSVSGRILVAVHGLNLLVAVDPETHLVYFPLQDIHGHPILRIMRPAGQK